ncbi:phosphate ABC transporter permease subunit PstC [uncultured Nitrospira sp.]|uniref:phosphate ABC transporter permease subunit PstC n=1 Tax=uncultured Nitrospira sp. TaxID=157176 RepID=UPI0031400B42
MISSSRNISSHFTSENLLSWSVRLLASLAGGLLLLVVAYLIREAWPALQQIGVSRFFSDPDWYPTEDLFLLTPMIWGTVLTTAGSVLLAAPLGILSALFCHFYAPPFLGRWYRRMIELLAGIPSVVFGFWGLVVLVPLIGRWHPPGPSLLAGILILTLMIIPTITLVAHASIAHIPAAYIHNATALGFSRWSIIRHVILPTTKVGLCTGILLGLARALGETMAMLMVCGNVVRTPSHLFDPIRTLTANIALEMAYALGNHRAALFVSGLFLMGLVVIFVALAEGLRHTNTNVATK